LFRLRNYFGATAVHLGLRSGGKFPQLTLIFNDIVDTTDNYKFYRQRWHDAPGLPFVYPHTHGLDPERKQADFFRFREYPKWRSDGNIDDLTSYFNRQTSSSLPVDRGWWPDLFTVLGSQLQQLLSCFGFTDQLVMARNRCHFDPEKGFQVNTEESVATHISGGRAPRLLSAMVYDPAVGISSSEAYRERARRCSKIACFSVLRQRGFTVWRLLPSFCLCGSSDRKYLCSDLEDKAYLSGPVNTKDALTQSRTNSSLSLNQLPKMGSSVDSFISSLEEVIRSMPSSAGNGSLHPGVDTCSSDSSNLGDNLSLSLSNYHLSPSHHPGMRPQIGDSLQTSISSMEIWVKGILSTPSEINNCYLPLILMQGPCQILSKRWSPAFDAIWRSLPSHCKSAHPSPIDKAIDVMRHIDPPLPHLPIMDPQWKPPRPDSNRTATYIAATMDGYLYFPFYLIPFAEFRRHICGEPSVLVLDVLDGISHIYNELRQLFTEHPEQRAVYEEAKKV
jgi:hypothetical protein